MAFKVKPNYVIIPSLTIMIGLAGRYLTQAGYAWYKTLNLPSFVPPSYVFGIAWNVIYLCTIFSALIVWNTFKRDWQFWMTVGLYILNGVFNILWSFLFFYQYNIRAALIDAVALELMVVGLIVLIWPRSRIAALLLVPYLLWVGFAIYMNWHIMLMNV